MICSRHGRLRAYAGGVTASLEPVEPCLPPGALGAGEEAGADSAGGRGAPVPRYGKGGVVADDIAVEPADLQSLEEAQPKLPRSIRIRVPLDTATAASVDALHTICQDRKGEAKLMFSVDRPGDFMVVMEPAGYNVCPDRSFMARVEELFGRGSVQIID